MNGNSCFWSISHHLFLRMKFMREENYESDLQSHLEPGEACYVVVSEIAGSNGKNGGGGF